MKNKNKLLNPTPAQIKYRNRLWANALIKNRKKATDTMYENGGRCCLAVAQDLAISCGLDKECKDYAPECPHPDVYKFFGWDKSGLSRVYLKLPNGDTEIAEGVNDESKYSYKGSKGMPHKRIAECVMNTFVHPKKPKWSFKLPHPSEW